MTLQEILGIDVPVIQAPMAGSQDCALTLAVSESGGLGSLPAAMFSLADLHAQLAQITARTTRPYNVNFFCHREPAFDVEREQHWRHALAPYFHEFGLDSAAVTAGPARAPFSAAALAVLREFAPPVVSFHFGLPSLELLQPIKSWGAKILASATTVDEARWLEAHGADVVIAQGLEAGGHRGNFIDEDLTRQLGTFALLPQIVRAVKLPVIAAGGIVDARTVAAAKAVGAVGVQSGTAYLLCPESLVSDVHRTALNAAAIDPAKAHTALTNLFSGRPARGLMNRLMRELGPLSDIPPGFPLASAALAPLRARAEKQGLGDFSPLWCGQNTSGCRELPAAQITRALAGGWS